METATDSARFESCALPKLIADVGDGLDRDPAIPSRHLSVLAS